MHTSEIVTDTDLFFITLTQLLPQVLGLATGAEARDTLTGWAREVSLSLWFGVQGGTGTQASREERHGGETKMSIK